MSQLRRKFSLQSTSDGASLTRSSKNRAAVSPRLQPPPPPPAFNPGTGSISSPRAQKSLKEILQDRIQISSESRRQSFEESSSGNSGISEDLSKYERMKKAGLPQDTVRRVMEREGVAIPHGFFGGGESEAPADIKPRQTVAPRSIRTASASSFVVEEKEKGREDEDEERGEVGRRSSIVSTRRDSRAGNKQVDVAMQQQQYSSASSFNVHERNTSPSIRYGGEEAVRNGRTASYSYEESKYPAAQEEDPWQAYFSQFIEQLQELKSEIRSIKSSERDTSREASEEVSRVREQLSKCVSERDLYWKQTQELSQQLFKESEKVQKALAASERLHLRIEQLDSSLKDKDKLVSEMQETQKNLSVLNTELTSKLAQAEKDIEAQEKQRKEAILQQDEHIQGLEKELEQVRKDNAKVVDTLATIVGGKDNLLLLASGESLPSSRRQRPRKSTASTAADKHSSLTTQEYGRKLMQGVERLKEELFLSKQEQESASMRMDHIRWEMSPKPLKYGRTKRTK